MLRLVEPPKEGQEKRARKAIDPPLSPPPNEQKRIHAAVRTLKRAYGGYDVLAKVMGVDADNLRKRRTRSYAFAYYLARAAGVSLEALLSPLKSVDVCPTCGARKGAK